MSVVTNEVNVPFTRFYDPGFDDPEWEEAGLAALTDESDETYISLDPLVDDYDAFWFTVDADDIPAGTVRSIYFSIRARTIRLDNPPEYISYTFSLVPLDGSGGYVTFGDGSLEHKGLEISNYISPGEEWSGEVGVYLDDDVMAEAIALPDGEWDAHNETWSNVNGFVTHLRNHGGFRVQMHQTVYLGAWEWAEANLVFEVETPSGSVSMSTPSRVRFTG